jgi:hypothetical protein
MPAPEVLPDAADGPVPMVEDAPAVAEPDWTAAATAADSAPLPVAMPPPLGSLHVYARASCYWSLTRSLYEGWGDTVAPAPLSLPVVRGVRADGEGDNRVPSTPDPIAHMAPPLSQAAASVPDTEPAPPVAAVASAAVPDAMGMGGLQSPAVAPEPVPQAEGDGELGTTAAMMMEEEEMGEEIVPEPFAPDEETVPDAAGAALDDAAEAAGPAPLGGELADGENDGGAEAEEVLVEDVDGGGGAAAPDAEAVIIETDAGGRVRRIVRPGTLAHGIVRVRGWQY